MKASDNCIVQQSDVALISVSSPQSPVASDATYSPPARRVASREM